jgi:quinoprotein glucose dehydrogenase
MPISPVSEARAHPPVGRRTVRGAAPLVAAILAAAPLLTAQVADWPAYGRDPGGSRFSPSAQITTANVSRLTVAWTFRTGEMGDAWHTDAPTAFEATPILVDGTLYVSTPLGRVFALDPATGDQRWMFDPRIDRGVGYGDFTNRGVSTWLDSAAAPGAPCRRRIFVAPIDGRLIALDAATGAPCPAFGARGTVDLRRDLLHEPRGAEYEVTSPPAVINGLVITGSAIADNNRTDAPSGVVRAYDARTGALRWSWDPIPRDSTDPAWRTWIGPKAHDTGAANAWSVIAADPARDLVFIPTGSASPDYYGGERRGDNRYANSLVALRASTGRVVWSYQMVHHDLWDYDLAAPPDLITVRRAGADIPAVAQATKSGQIFILNRETGVPLFPVIERRVPPSTVPGEVASPTQPFPSLPAPIAPQTFDDSDLWGRTPDELESCRALAAGMRRGSIFTPPSFEGTIVVPSNVGGAHWGGTAFDAAHGLLIVPSNHLAAGIALIPRERLAEARRDTVHARADYTDMHGTPYVLRREILVSKGGLPCNRPPWGVLQAIDVATGATAWQVPLGTIADRVPDLAEHPDAYPAGSPNLGGPIVTAGGVVFIGAAMDDWLRAFDAQTGRELWKGRLPASPQATPMTYQLTPSGLQYVVIVAGGHGHLGTTRGDYVIAYTLR